MEQLLKACSIALKYFQESYGENWIIQSIRELKDKWIFSQMNIKNPMEGFYGYQPIAIDKKDFQVSLYIIIENLEELEKSVEIEIPTKYKKAP